jgi:hypothetical protein
MILHPSEIIRKLFANVGQPIQSQRQRMDSLIRNCMSFQDRDFCYLVLNVAAEPHIPWCHNTGSHFGGQHERITYEGYLDLVHPSWRVPYYLYGEVAYSICASRPEQLQKEKIVFTQSLPLLGADGKYYWYDQVAIPGELDPAGQLVSHLNYYRRLAPYDSFTPSSPRLFSGGNIDQELSEFFHLKAKQFLVPFLTSFFTRQQIEFLQAYRKLPEVLAGNKPARKSGAELMKMNIKSYDKVQQRIKSDGLEVHFDGFLADTAHAFACFLNQYFPEKWS